MGKVIEDLKRAHREQRDITLSHAQIADLLTEINHEVFTGQIAENLSVSEFLRTRAADDSKRGNTKAANYVLALKDVIDAVRVKRSAAMGIKTQ